MINIVEVRLTLDEQNPLHQMVLEARREALISDPQFRVGQLPQSIPFSMQLKRSFRNEDQFFSRSDGIWLLAFESERDRWNNILATEIMPNVLPSVHYDVLVDHLSELVDPWQFDRIRIQGQLEYDEFVSHGCYTQDGMYAELDGTFDHVNSMRNFTFESSQDRETTLEFFRQILDGEVVPSTRLISAHNVLVASASGYRALAKDEDLSNWGSERVQSAISTLKSVRLPDWVLTDSLAEAST